MNETNNIKYLIWMNKKMRVRRSVLVVSFLVEGTRYVELGTSAEPPVNKILFSRALLMNVGAVGIVLSNEDKDVVDNLTISDFLASTLAVAIDCYSFYLTTRR